MTKPTDYRRFNYWLLGAVGAILLLIAGLNYFVDPYGVWMAPRVERINKLKPLMDTKNGLRVSWEIRRRKPRALVFGTSTSMQLKPAEFGAAVGEPASNAGLIMSSPSEIRSLLDLAIAEQPKVDHVLLAVDFLQFNSTSFVASKTIEPSTETTALAQESLSLLVSAPGLAASTSTLARNLNPPPAKTPTPKKELFKKYFPMVTPDYLPYGLSEPELSDLQGIVNRCRERGIDLQVVITPMHAQHMDWLYSNGLGKQYNEWRRRVVAITPVWDFSGYNQVTTEPVSDSMKNYLDPLHYSPTTGALMIRRVYGEPGAMPGFGALVTSATVEAHLAEEARARQTYEIRLSRGGD